MNRSCRQAQRWVVRSLDGELDGRREAKLAEHLRTCERCRVEVEAFKSLRAEWSGLPGIASDPEDRMRIRSLAATVPDRRSLRLGTLQWADAVTTAALATSVLLAGLMIRDRVVRSPVGPPSFEALTLAELIAREKAVPLREESRPLEGLPESRD